MPDESSNFDAGSILKKGLMNALIPLLVTGMAGYFTIQATVPQMVKNVENLTKELGKMSEDMYALREDYIVHRVSSSLQSERMDRVQDIQTDVLKKLSERIVVLETLLER